MIIALLLMVTFLFKCLFLLCFLPSGRALAQSCSSLLQPDYSLYNFSILKRARADIADNQRSREFLQRLTEEGAVVQSPYVSPYSREQCYGTCYAYASLALVEHELTVAKKIEASAMLIAPSLLMQVAQDRFNTGSTGENFEELLNGGTHDVLHAIHGRQIYYFPKENIKRLGSLIKSSVKLMDLESNFLNDHLARLSSEINSTSPPLLSQDGLVGAVTDEYVHYVNDIMREEEGPGIDYEALGPLSVSYDIHELNSIYMEDEGQTYNVISFTNVDVEQVPTLQELPAHTRAHGDFRIVNSDAFDNESIRTIIRQVQNDKYIWVALKTGIFGGEHGVALTNLVVNHVTKNILGFVFLDSNHRRQGYGGYRFISVRELQENMTSFAYINSININ